METTTKTTKKQFTHERHPHLQLMRDEWERFYWGMMLRVRDDPEGILTEERLLMDQVLALQKKLWKISPRTGLTDGMDEERRDAIRAKVEAEREARARDAVAEQLAGVGASEWSVSRLKFGRRQFACEEVLRLCGLRKSKAVVKTLDELAQDIATFA